METRDSFVFYRSFFEAIAELAPEDQAPVILAICEYALNGTVPDLTGVPKAMFMLIKPNLDANKKKWENGKKGGRPRTRREPNENQGETTEDEPGNQVGTEQEPNVLCLMHNEGCLMGNEDDDTARANALSVVMSAYRENINPRPSKTSMDELKGYVEEMGCECCLRAFDIALDAQKPKWTYIRGILRTKLSQGVHCIADWDELERQHEAAQKKRTSGKNSPPSSQDSPADARADMERMQRYLAEQRREIASAANN